MDSSAASVRQRGTTSAIGPDGRQVYFDDVVRDGGIVEVAGRRMVVIYDPMAPDWFVFEARGGAAIPAGPEVASAPTAPTSPEGVTLNPIPSGGPGSERPVTNAPAVGRPRLKSKATGAPDAATVSYDDDPRVRVWSSTARYHRERGNATAANLAADVADAIRFYLLHLTSQGFKQPRAWRSTATSGSWRLHTDSLRTLGGPPIPDRLNP